MSSMTFFKRMADVVNFEHWGINKTGSDIFKGFLSNYGLELQESTLRQIHSVEFCNSICVVRKSTVEYNRLGCRVIAGQTEEVAKGHLDLPGNYRIEVKSQEANFWSSRSLPPAEELQLRLEEVASQASRIAELKQLVEIRDAQAKDLGQEVTGLKQLAEDRDAQAKGLEQGAELKKFSKTGMLRQGPESGSCSTETVCGRSGCSGEGPGAGNRWTETACGRSRSPGERSEPGSSIA